MARRSLPGRTRVREEMEICRKKRTNRMLIAMVVIFAICWLPLNIVHMVAEFHRSELKHYKVLFLSTHVIAMSSTIYNPFLYSWLNDNFRKEFQQILPCLFKLCVCFQSDRSSSLTNTNNNNHHQAFPGGEICQDRPSANHFHVETSTNGKTNGCSPKHVQLTTMHSGALLQEPLLNSNPSTEMHPNHNEL